MTWNVKVFYFQPLISLDHMLTLTRALSLPLLKLTLTSGVKNNFPFYSLRSRLPTPNSDGVKNIYGTISLFQQTPRILFIHLIPVEVKCIKSFFLSLESHKHKFYP